MPQAVQVDFETLGVGHMAMPTRLGAVLFDPDAWYDDIMLSKLTAFDAYFSPEQLQELGFKLTNQTLLFWKKLNFHSCFPDQEIDMRPVHEVLCAFEDYCDSARVTGNLDTRATWLKKIVIYIRGTKFDGSILEALYHKIGKHFPFAYNCDRDVRTILDMLYGNTSGPKINIPGLLKHNPVSDCLYQIRQVQDTRRKFKALMKPNDYGSDL